MKRLGIVTPWFGPALTGGAEQIAYQLATRLHARGHRVVALTTCCRSFRDDWATNHYQPGESVERGVIVRRFAVDPRAVEKFEAVNQRLLSVPTRELRPGVSPIDAEDERIFVGDNINSRDLVTHLRERADEYDAFIFLPYLYGPILNGLPEARGKALLQPCLHDEAYAYLPEVARLFRDARAVLFNSEGEARLARRLFGPGVIPKSTVVGLGVEEAAGEEDAAGDEDARGGLPEGLAGARFVLCLGRKDVTKNTDLLLDAFRRFRAAHPGSTLRLVFAGPGDLPPSETATHDPHVIDLGLVSERRKHALLRACLALFQPSRNESYSRVMMEAWRGGRPVAAHGECLATAIAVEESGGGWTATAVDEWAALFAMIDAAAPDELRARGAAGGAYAAQYADWESTLDRCEETLDRVLAANGPTAIVTRPNAAAVHQLLPNLTFGDAISNQALEIRARLRERGHRSEIFVKHLGERVESEGRIFAPHLIGGDDALIYHHSIGSEVTNFALQHRGPKCLVYHNITPAYFFEPYRPGFAWMLEVGREQLPRLAGDFALSAGDSAYNAAELTACGFAGPRVLPIIIDPARWDTPADPQLMRELQDGKINVLYVGRFSPNKCQHHLVAAFAEFRALLPHSRLILAGDGRDFGPFYRRVTETIRAHDLTEHVIVAGQIDEAQLLAYYRTAHLFWSMSEHEGFGAPPVEAMWFDVPVLAFDATATPETLGAAGALFDQKSDFAKIAQTAADLVGDRRVRERVLRAQRERRETFTPLALRPTLDGLIDRLLAQRRRTAA